MKTTRNEPRPGDILLFYRARRLSRIITWFSGSRFYHVGLYAGDHHVVESRVRSVVCRDLRSRDGGHSFLVVPAPEDAGRAALDWARRQVGDGYPVWSVLALVLDRLFTSLEINITQRNQFSCGELVAKAFAHAGVQLFPGQELENVAPWEFARLLLADAPAEPMTAADAEDTSLFIGVEEAGHR